MNEMLELLARRRSIPAPLLSEPGPTAAQLDRLLTLAARVPDHGRLVPWRFVIMSGAAKRRFCDRIAELYAARDPEASERKIETERDRFHHAPVVVCVVSRTIADHKVPVIEQVLSSGAVSMNLLTAASAMGFAATWLTGWPAYDPEAKEALGIEETENISGFVHIGTARDRVPDRERPDIPSIVTQL